VTLALGIRGLSAVAVVIWFAGCTSQPSSGGSPASSGSPSISADLPSGIYVNGPPGTPHYFIALTDTTAGAFRGTVSFSAQDGQTSAAFTFTATTQSGIATLTTSSGRIITAPMGPKQISLGVCTDYLPFVQGLADCSFTFAPGGLSG
jgi:hypothetical protein